MRDNPFREIPPSPHMIIAVGSKNPTKIRPVKKVFSYYFGEVTVVSSEIASGVADHHYQKKRCIKEH